jgi:hypothetical protein
MTDREADDLFEGLAVHVGHNTHGEAVAAIRTYVGGLRAVADGLVPNAWMRVQGGLACIHCLRVHATDPTSIEHGEACPVRRRAEMRGGPVGGDGRQELHL